MKPIPRISDSEWKVMEIAWENPPITAQDVQDALGENERWKPQTVKTLIGRLVKKGAISFKKDGHRYLYSPEIDRESAVAAEADTFLDRISRGSVAPLLAHLVQSRNSLSKEELDSLRALLNSKPEHSDK